MLLKAVFLKRLADAGLTSPDAALVADYLAVRMPRSASAAGRLAAEIECLVAGERRPFGIATARLALAAVAQS
jgi:hypothetical protein